jgi:hypothetical protein
VPKFLLNLLVQISKALVNSKIQFLFRKEFLFSSGPLGQAAPSAYSAFWPTRLTQPISLCIQHPPAVSPPPLFIPRIKHHLKSSRSIPIYHRQFLRHNHRPPPPPRPLYKGRAPPSSTAHLPVLLFSPRPRAACTKRHHHRLFTIIARSPCRCLHSGEA